MGDVVDEAASEKSTGPELAQNMLHKGSIEMRVRVSVPELFLAPTLLDRIVRFC